MGPEHPIAPARRQSLTEQVYRGLREALALGDLAPGERITNEGLAERFAVSTTPVREALQRLLSEGLLVQAPGGATAVPALDAEAVRRIMDVARVLEGLAAERAAAHFGAAEIAESRAATLALRAAYVAGERRETMRQRRVLSSVLYRRCGNPVLLRQIDLLGVMQGPIASALMPHFASGAQRRRHEALLKAMEARDGKAARRLVEELVEGSLALMLEALAAKDGAIAARGTRTGLTSP